MSMIGQACPNVQRTSPSFRSWKKAPVPARASPTTWSPPSLGAMQGREPCGDEEQRPIEGPEMESPSPDDARVGLPGDKGPVGPNTSSSQRE